MMLSLSRPACRLLCTGVVLSLVVPASALTINATYTDSAGETWDATRIGVVEYAISEWETLIQNDEVVNIEFDFTTGNGYLAQWHGVRSYYFGDDITPWYAGVTHTIHFNADLMDTSLANYLWFDETPDTDNDQAFAVWDALSVARHELGHAMGFVNNFYVDNVGTGSEVNNWGMQINASNIFDPTGLAVPMNGSDWAHVAESGLMAEDLMSPTLYNADRHEISNTDMAMLATAYGYDVVPEPTITGALAFGAIAMLRRRRRVA